MAQKPLVVLVGPTAIGKSQVGLRIAKSLGTEILTADSTQVYQGMDIGTDKPTPHEQLEVPHQLIDLVEPDQPFNAGEFRRQALVEIDRLYHEGRVPFVVGGTGLYVRVLVRGLWPGPPVNREIRRHLEEEHEMKGLDHLYRELNRVDPESARLLHSHDRVKVLRALEVYRQVGVPRSFLHQRHAFRERPFQTLILGLRMDRQALYKRIDTRVELELAKGLVEETRRLLDQGYSRDLTSMKSLGYRQMGSFLVGECGFDEAVTRLKRDTRRFAKRQMTWFRKEPNIEWIDMGDQEPPDSAVTRILARVEEFLRSLSDQPCSDKVPTTGAPRRSLTNHSEDGLNF